MTRSAIDLAELGEAVEWVDAVASTAAADAGTDAGPVSSHGRLVEVAGWLAATQGVFPPHPPVRARCVILGAVPPATAAVADSVGVGVRALTVGAGPTPTGALAAGVRAADDEVDAGADLVVIAAPASPVAAAVLVALLTGAEPVALLPRGAAAVDTLAWIERAEHLRRTRRAVAALRARPDELLAALDDAELAAAVGLVMRAAARRTAIVLDGTTAIAAALLCQDVQPRAGRWWRVADRCADPVHVHAVAELATEPLLDLAASGGAGVPGLLTVPLLRAAALVLAPDGAAEHD